jgi:diphthamide synthase (EF-2-diphthine--ammonia ligase)
MQYSGHPGCMERVCNRAGNESLEPLKATENYRKATQFITGSEEL